MNFLFSARMLPVPVTTALHPSPGKKKRAGELIATRPLFDPSADYCVKRRTWLPVPVEIAIAVPMVFSVATNPPVAAALLVML